MAMHEAGIRLRTSDSSSTARSDALAALPSGTLVAIYETRPGAGAAAVQLLTRGADVCLWLRSGRDAATAIRAARSRRSFAMRVLRGFGNEELLVRQVLRQAGEGRSVLIVRDNNVLSLRALSEAIHVYQFGTWTARAIS